MSSISSYPSRLLRRGGPCLRATRFLRRLSRKHRLHMVCMRSICHCRERTGCTYRGNSLIRSFPPLGTYSTRCSHTSGPMVVLGGGLFLMSEVPMQRPPRLVNHLVRPSGFTEPLGPLGFEGAQHRPTLRPSRRQDPQQSPASFRRIAVKDLTEHRERPLLNQVHKSLHDSRRQSCCGYLGVSGLYRGTSLIRKHYLLGPYSVQWDYPGTYGGSWGRGLFLVSEVPL